MMPESDNDWIIHSLNIHGVFLELWCEKTISNDPNWRIRSVHEAVEFPPPQGPVRGKESHLDIRAERWTDDALLTLLVECKKANPEFVNWIFFPSQTISKTNALIFSEITTTDVSESNVRRSGVLTLRREFPFKDIPFTNEARETRGSYQGYKKNDKTRTANAAISDAAYQVALGMQSILYDQIKTIQEISLTSSRKPLWSHQILLPIIVTTANLFTCESNPSDVDPKTGEIHPYDKARLIPQDYLLFEYPLPRHLQLLPEYFPNDNLLLPELIRKMRVEAFKKKIDPTRMYIIIMNSGYFARFLKEIDGVALRLLYAI
jgi:hypothetical protein